MLVGQVQGGNSGESIEVDTISGHVFGAMDGTRPCTCFLIGVADRLARSPFGDRRCPVVCLVPLIQILVVGPLP